MKQGKIVTLAPTDVAFFGFKAGVQKKIGHGEEKWRRRQSIRYKEKTMVFILPSPEIVDMTELTIVGLGGEYCLETRDEIPRLWWQLQSERHPIQQGVRATTYGVFQNVSTDAPFAYYGRFFYIAGIVAGNNEVAHRPFYSVTLQGGRYAVFRFTGSYSEMTRAFDSVMLRWLPESEWQLDSREVFERYPCYRIGDKELPVFEVWVPLTEKA